MSRIGKTVIDLNGVNFEQNENLLIFKKGTNSNDVKIDNNFKIVQETNVLKIVPINENRAHEKQIKSMWGTYNRLIKNAIIGVQVPSETKISLVGIGFKIAMEGANKLKFSLGYSHVVIIEIPSGITITLEGQSLFTVRSVKKDLLGQFVHKLIKLKKADVYKGKGIKRISSNFKVKYYDNRKEAKKGKK